MSIYLGIDWSEQKHDCLFLNEAGAFLVRLGIPHTSEGLAKLERTCQQLAGDAADCLVGLETAHNLLIDLLWAQHYSQVYVIPSTRLRYRPAYRLTGAQNPR